MTNFHIVKDDQLFLIPKQFNDRLIHISFSRIVSNGLREVLVRKSRSADSYPEISWLTHYLINMSLEDQTYLKLCGVTLVLEDRKEYRLSIEAAMNFGASYISGAA